MSLSFLLYTHKHPPTGPGSLENPNTPSNVKIGWNDIKYVHYVKKTTLKKKKARRAGGKGSPQTYFYKVLNYYLVWFIY